jgi:hypothetical protein
VSAAPVHQLKVRLLVAAIPCDTRFKVRRRRVRTFFITLLPVDKLHPFCSIQGVYYCKCCADACARDDTVSFGDPASGKDPHHSHGFCGMGGTIWKTLTHVDYCTVLHTDPLQTPVTPTFTRRQGKLQSIGRSTARDYFPCITLLTQYLPDFHMQI